MALLDLARIPVNASSSDGSAVDPGKLKGVVIAGTTYANGAPTSLLRPNGAKL